MDDDNGSLTRGVSSRCSSQGLQLVCTGSEAVRSKYGRALSTPTIPTILCLSSLWRERKQSVMEILSPSCSKAFGSAFGPSCCLSQPRSPKTTTASFAFAAELAASEKFVSGQDVVLQPGMKVTSLSERPVPALRMPPSMLVTLEEQFACDPARSMRSATPICAKAESHATGAAEDHAHRIAGIIA